MCQNYVSVPASQRVPAASTQANVYKYHALAKDSSVSGWVPAQGASSGSGVILDPDGTILTNAHIVAEASAERLGGMAGTSARTPVVHVALQDGRVFEGQVISSDRCPAQKAASSAARFLVSWTKHNCISHTLTC